MDRSADAAGIPSPAPSAVTEQDALRALATWRRRPGVPAARLEALVHHEHLAPALLQERARHRLMGVLDHARSTCDHWRAVLPGTPDRHDPLAGVPILDRDTVRSEAAALTATHRPAPDAEARWATSAPHAGPPVRVLQTARSVQMVPLLLHRAVRWAGWRPTGTLAAIVSPARLPPHADTSRGHSLPVWPALGRTFHTGPFVALRHDAPVDEQLAWLRTHRPDHLLAHPRVLQALVWAAGGPPADSLSGVRAAGATPTAGEHRRIEAGFGRPPVSTHSLDEIGIVGIRCAAGRWHAAVEHVHVEFLDDDAKPVAPGAPGRVAVTSLTNPAMPLFRYDTGDVATPCAPDDPCPCGRTLPSYRSLRRHQDLFARTPPGTRDRIECLDAALAKLPLRHLTSLRGVALHQLASGAFDLWLACTDPLPHAATTALRAAWDALGEGPALQVRTAETLPRTLGLPWPWFRSSTLHGPPPTP